MGIETPKGFIDIEGFTLVDKGFPYKIRATINLNHIISASKVMRDKEELTMIKLTDGRCIETKRTYEAFLKDMINVQ